MQQAGVFHHSVRVEPFSHTVLLQLDPINLNTHAYYNHEPLSLHYELLL